MEEWDLLDKEAACSRTRRDVKPSCSSPEEHEGNCVTRRKREKSEQRPGQEAPLSHPQQAPRLKAGGMTVGIFIRDVCFR